MPRTLTAAVSLCAMALGLSLGAVPAAAQDDNASAGGDRVNQLIVYGDDPCPQSTADEITVCARKDESERYRIPEPLRGSDSPANTAWTNKVEAYETVGSFGTLSCSPAGAGGWLGCTQHLIDAAYAEKKESSEVKFSELIQKEREKRLSTIDADAAAQQARVEEAEQAYFDQQKRKAAEQDKTETSGDKKDADTPAPQGQ